MMKSKSITQYLHHRLSLILIPLTVLLLAGSPAFAVPMLQFSSGQLTGATGVDVGGMLYDVTLMDGTCVDLFDGCDAVSDFPFPTLAASFAAYTALGGVLTAEAFAYIPDNIRGCVAPGFCELVTPFDFLDPAVIDGRGVMLAQGGGVVNPHSPRS